MAGHFAAFSFVDRITELQAGTRARGYFVVPDYLPEFPSCLVAEAVGQLAAWVAMAQVEFRRRPVAALATETIFHCAVKPGQTLQLGVDIEQCDDEAVAYGGFARVDGVDVIELKHCLGPMLPVEEFDSPDALRERFHLLRGRGAAGNRFHAIAICCKASCSETLQPTREVRAGLASSALPKQEKLNARATAAPARSVC